MEPAHAGYFQKARSGLIGGAGSWVWRGYNGGSERHLKDVFMVKVLLALAVLVGLAACSTTPTPTPINISLVDPGDLPTSTFTDPAMRTAEANYQIYCAHCHGYNGEGQALRAPGETERVGLKMVPPHDSTGNIWRYADPVLIEVIKIGIQNPLDQYPMIPFEGVISDEEMTGLLDYIKLWWTDAQREYQAVVTANHLLALADPGAEFAPLPPVEG